MTKLQIINLALRHLGMNKLADLTGLDPSTLVMLEFWDICKNTMFEEHQWSFAQVQETLNAATEDVPLGWTYLYDMPSTNYATVWSVFNEGTLTDKDLQDFDSYLIPATGEVKIVSNLDEASCEYTYIVEDEEAWPGKFAHAMSYFLAASACGSLTGDADKALKLMQVYSTLVADVKRIDASKQRKKPLLSSDTVNSRG